MNRRVEIAVCSVKVVGSHTKGEKCARARSRSAGKRESGSESDSERSEVAG